MTTLYLLDVKFEISEELYNEITGQMKIYNRTVDQELKTALNSYYKNKISIENTK